MEDVWKENRGTHWQFWGWKTRVRTCVGAWAMPTVVHLTTRETRRFRSCTALCNWAAELKQSSLKSLDISPTTPLSTDIWPAPELTHCNLLQFLPWSKPFLWHKVRLYWRFVCKHVTLLFLVLKYRVDGNCCTEVPGTAYKGCCFTVTVTSVFGSFLAENHLNIDPWGVTAPS